MKSQYLTNPPKSFRTKTSYLYAVLALALGGSVLVGLVIQHGALALVREGWLVYLAVYAVYYLLVLPKLVVDFDEITVHNPFRIHRVNYAALIDVSTKFNLTLVTPTAKYQAFAIPSTGMSAMLDRNQGDASKLPSISYAGDGVIRTSDLPHGFSGSVALVIRGYWQELVEDGALEATTPETSSRTDWVGIAIFAVLALGAVATVVF